MFLFTALEGDQPIPIINVWNLKRIEDKAGRKRLADIFKHATERGYLDQIKGINEFNSII